MQTRAIAYPQPLQPTIRGRLERLVSREWGWCLCCGRPWRCVEAHRTEYLRAPQLVDGAVVAGMRWGVFALCERCWSRLGVLERLRYYRLLWECWETRDAEQWRAIEAAVMAGR